MDSLPVFMPGLRVRLTTPGPMNGAEATLDVPVSATRWRIIAHGGMWHGRAFTVAEDFMERVKC